MKGSSLFLYGGRGEIEVRVQLEFLRRRNVASYFRFDGIVQQAIVRQAGHQHFVLGSRGRSTERRRLLPVAKKQSRRHGLLRPPANPGRIGTHELRDRPPLQLDRDDETVLFLLVATSNFLCRDGSIIDTGFVQHSVQWVIRVAVVVGPHLIEAGRRSVDGTVLSVGLAFHLTVDVERRGRPVVGRGDMIPVSRQDTGFACNSRGARVTIFGGKGEQEVRLMTSQQPALVCLLRLFKATDNSALRVGFVDTDPGFRRHRLAEAGRFAPDRLK